MSVLSLVRVIDERPAWMRKEDDTALCMSRCRYFRNCMSKFGASCKNLNGDKIPIMKNAITSHVKTITTF